MAEQTDKRRAAARNKEGLEYYENWDIDNAVAAFKEAAEADSENPEYHLNLARAYARSADYSQAMQALGHYLRTETNEKVAERYERLFSSALDDVEQTMIETMRELELPIQQIGKAIQMWLEYRITIGRRPLPIPKPELWAAALTYAVVKVNFTEMKRADIAAAYSVNEQSLKRKYDELVGELDLMPADYRYFAGEENPLDKLVEAARLLEELDRKFHADE